MRQACNVAYATLAENKTEEQMEELDTALGMAADPEEGARAALREYQREQDITFEDPDAPVAPTVPDLTGEIRGEHW